MDTQRDGNLPGHQVDTQRDGNLPGHQVDTQRDGDISKTYYLVGLILIQILHGLAKQMEGRRFRKVPLL